MLNLIIKIIMWYPQACNRKFHLSFLTYSFSPNNLFSFFNIGFEKSLLQCSIFFKSFYYNTRDEFDNLVHFFFTFMLPSNVLSLTFKQWLFGEIFVCDIGYLSIPTLFLVNVSSQTQSWYEKWKYSTTSSLLTREYTLCSQPVI